jgi:hypothetical protein
MIEKNKVLLRTTTMALFLALFVMGSINQINEKADESSMDDPTVVSIFPADGEMNVSRNVVIKITFSEEMDSTHFASFTLMQAGESISGTFDYSGKSASFMTSESLMAETEYVANLTFANNHFDNNNINNQTEEVYHVENGKEWSFTTGGVNGMIEKVDLGSAANYVILAKSSIIHDSSSEITGEQGSNSKIKGSNSEKKSVYWVKNEDVDKIVMAKDTTQSKSVNRENTLGATNDSDSDVKNIAGALDDMIKAYSNAESRSSVDFHNFAMISSTDISKKSEKSDRMVSYSQDSLYQHSNEIEIRLNEGYTTESGMNVKSYPTSLKLEPGLYMWDESVKISRNIILSGNAEDVWIFQILNNLTVESDVQISLRDGALPENIFWQVAGEVNIGTMAHFEGIILSKKAITMENGATLNGRLLTQTDVTLDNNTITEPSLLTSVQRTTRND